LTAVTLLLEFAQNKGHHSSLLFFFPPFSRTSARSPCPFHASQPRGFGQEASYCCFVNSRSISEPFLQGDCIAMLRLHLAARFPLFLLFASLLFLNLHPDSMAFSRGQPISFRQKRCASITSVPCGAKGPNTVRLLFFRKRCTTQLLTLLFFLFCSSSVFQSSGSAFSHSYSHCI
jgi:hypothetical protein